MRESMVVGMRMLGPPARMGMLALLLPGGPPLIMRGAMGPPPPPPIIPILPMAFMWDIWWFMNWDWDMGCMLL
jgi:hypothetical protein